MIRTVILAGGAGTRFWPMSRNNKPKQLLSLFSEKSMLEETIERSKPFSDSISISTGENLREPIENLKTECKLIVEPCRRDTAAAIGLCATQFDENDTLVFLPSDAYIKENDLFAETIEEAVKLAEDAITVIGIKPNKVATGYGYLETKDNSVVSFREKPDEDTAKEYVEKGFLWNAGIFVVKVSTLMNSFKEFEPEIYEKLLQMKETGDVENIYPTIKKISFDYAVMEKAEKVNFVPAKFYWNDVGSFDAIHEVVGESNVVMNGEFEKVDSEGNVVSSKKTVALVDCEDLIVIDTDDVLLVCPRSSAQKVKDIANQVDDSLK